MDDRGVLEGFVEAFVEAPIPVVYPVHPRTEKRLRRWKMWGKLSSAENVQVLPPVGYFDFLVLMKNCEMLVTDSGGLQEEATAPCIRKPVLVIRLSTERPEAVEAGFVKVVGVEKAGILVAMEEVLKGKGRLPGVSPYGDGTAAREIVKVVMEEISK